MTIGFSMLDNATQSTRQMAVETPFGADVLLLRKFSGHEELSHLFEYELEMLSADDSLDPTQIVGQNVTWMLDQSGEDPRFFNGQVSRFRYSGQTDLGTTYRATIVPWLWFLTQTRDCRMFQHKTTPDIIQQIFSDLDFTDFQLQLSASYETLEYCVQYRESDFNFVSRLMEEEGIYYFFKHENGKHTLVLSDQTETYFKLPDSEVEMADPDHTGDLVDQITEWEHELAFRPGKWAQTDFNFKVPGNDLMSTAETRIPIPQAKNFEIYDYPGRFPHRGHGNSLTTIRMEEHEVDHNVVTGAATYRSLTPGGTFTVLRHRTQSEVGKEYVVRGIDIEASVGGSYDVDLASAGEMRFHCGFQSIPADVIFRPAFDTAKPRVEGPQTAIITGPPGEEIFPDEFGRVKVQFHWDREGKYDDNSSCWLRVSQTHAGAGWGMMDLPRVGEEVIVSFLEGDPDRPIITGRVYNGQNMPPYDLPSGKTRRGNKTKTYKGQGYNEMTMDDTPGKEQLRTNAQYNMNSNVNNDQTLDVGNNQSENVGVDRTRTVGSNESVTVGVNQTEDVGSNRTTTVGANDSETVGSNQTVDIGSNQSISVGSNQSNTIGSKQSTQIGSIKHESVGMAANQMVGIAKATTVGVIKNEAVGLMSFEQVGLKKSTIVGTKYGISTGTNFTLEAGTKIELKCGASKLCMDAGGVITIEGTAILMTASGPVKINGSVIDLN